MIYYKTFTLPPHLSISRHPHRNSVSLPNLAENHHHYYHHRLSIVIAPSPIAPPTSTTMTHPRATLNSHHATIITGHQQPLNHPSQPQTSPPSLPSSSNCCRTEQSTVKVRAKKGRGRGGTW